jgi:hypothetical protein
MTNTQLEAKIDRLAQQLAQREHKSLWNTFNIKHLKLHTAKQIMAYMAPRLAAEVPTVPATFPVTQMLDEVLNTMKELMPEQYHADSNFANAVELMRKFIIFLAESDCYYRGWLELFCMLLANATEQRLPLLAQEVQT